MSKTLFQNFQESIAQILDRYKLSENDVDYVILTNTHWMPIRDFLTSEIPTVWTHFDKGSLGEWEIPTTFRIVMKDNRWIQYHYIWDDPYYSDFYLNVPPIKPEEQYQNE